ncbi:polysaccharide deacetylase family protein [Gilvimarinus sp. SDUM040013]|uniref:Polysaccharide deacetylase family protein n=1 Tax=Gilvimarinus gilvus TaxID=3058038 RepID=A0ABU4S010_9GAMM|nr:polysaccharide deacetylase family protein [Gilvimarinus sp. SDUM040013]MDO3387369.1 polysaccharide deacetylase family protein [Gilvimarinus sp. SDUM040013]MDX6849846.1 polysaccharide deacetylase family protein [Gilvimarinus sp. SDUM040013]
MLPLKELLDQQLAGVQRAPSVAITFDDGYSDIYEIAAPALLKNNFPFTVFINTESVGAPGYMSWSQLKSLQEMGASVANHTVTHPHLMRRQESENRSQWRRRIKREIVEAQSDIEAHLGESPLLFAYPYGEFDASVTALVQSLGYRGLGQHSGAVGKLTDPLRIPRFPMGGNYGELDSFATKVASLPLPVVEEGVVQRSDGLSDAYVLLAGQTATLKLALAEPGLGNRLNCFFRGEQIDVVEKTPEIVHVPLPDALTAGRTRVNCTAKEAGGNRYYWHSYPLFIKGEDGAWKHQD